MTSPCLGCGQPTWHPDRQKPACCRCMEIYLSVLPQLLESRRNFGDWIPTVEEYRWPKKPVMRRAT